MTGWIGVRRAVVRVGLIALRPQRGNGPLAVRLGAGTALLDPSLRAGCSAPLPWWLLGGRAPPQSCTEAWPCIRAP